MIVKASPLSARTLGSMARRAEMDIAETLLNPATVRRLNRVYRRQVGRQKGRGDLAFT